MYAATDAVYWYSNGDCMHVGVNGTYTSHFISVHFALSTFLAGLKLTNVRNKFEVLGCVILPYSWWHSQMPHI